MALLTATFALAFAMRSLNVRFAQIAPADELYHWKRIGFSGAHFPRVLEFDRDRGIDGAFCPWPPLYDLAAGGIARLFGMDAVKWIPPAIGAAAVAIAALWVAANFGFASGLAAAIALACSPFIVTQSWVGAIDHHYLEWILVLGILIAAEGRGGALSVAMTAALFVQSALILACGLAFAVCFARDDRRASGAFFASAAAVALYRLTRAPGYPNSAWFLGWPHVLLLIAAGVALLVRPRLLGLACGAAIAAIAPIRQGLHFFGGDRWLQTIIEFQPMWRSTGADLVSQLVGLGAGAILVWFLLRDARTRPIALFAIVFLILTIDNRRFWSISIPLLAIAGSIAATRVRFRRTAMAAVAIVPALQLAGWMQHPQRPIERYEIPWIQAAEFLRSQPPGRVLAPWAMGHAIDVIGHHPVIVDGFGTMPDEKTFVAAHQAMLAPDEASLARDCDAMHVRYVALYDPQFGLRTAAKIAGVREPKIQSTWYGRAYNGNVSTPRFRLIYRTAPEFMRAAVVIWEYRGGA